MTRTNNAPQPVIPAALLQRHALEVPYQRGKVSQATVRRVFREPGTVLGNFVNNWLGGGLFATMLHNVFFGEEERYVEARKTLREAGLRRRPRQLHFDALALIEEAHPRLLSSEDLAAGLEISLSEVNQVVTYLRGFVLAMCGVCVLKTSKGEVCIATIDLWMDWQNQMTRIENGIRRSKERHGMKEENLKSNKLQVAERLPTYQPVMLELMPPARKQVLPSDTN
ncbi:hypothetical protein E7T06_07390 [Deinococcus sp. Arct2-2]|uniref:hypothetical protein n=1 Tax=Deinococcus sp. Arct2-2 TaxID=2568653 RepID=UPI0010A434E1|nr:hypothetical protein [Deinococcus sp. Arct2-2]THF70519.1 hypothetical protein E7T06_07390 [Deinococcus sp. Arct2-2]